MAERKGLEPSASGVTGRRYNRLNYRSAKATFRFPERRQTHSNLSDMESGGNPDCEQMAERKGLEPSASGVTGRRYNRLNYRSACAWWAVQDLNL